MPLRNSPLAVWISTSASDSGSAMPGKAQQQVVDPTEDRGIHADAKGERQHCDKCEAWMIAQDPKTVPKIGEYRMHDKHTYTSSAKPPSRAIRPERLL